MAAHVLGLEAHGVDLLGEVPQGLPAIGLPAVGWNDVDQLLALALACFLLGAVETAAIGRLFETALACGEGRPWEDDATIVVVKRVETPS